jgi:hypothetical protein
MDETTQQNSALVEENAATAKTLEEQAKSMDERVASFRLRDSALRNGVALSSPVPDDAITPLTKSGVKTLIQPQKQRATVGGARPVVQVRTTDNVKSDSDWKEF